MLIKRPKKKLSSSNNLYKRLKRRFQVLNLRLMSLLLMPMHLLWSVRLLNKNPVKRNKKTTVLKMKIKKTKKTSTSLGQTTSR